MTTTRSYVHPTRKCCQCGGDLRFTDRTFDNSWGGQTLGTTTIAKECLNGCLGQVDTIG